MRVLLIDNYDSFTWNLVQRFGELDPGVEVVVKRNDEISPSEAEALEPDRLVISPGPCTPREAGVSGAMIEHFAGVVPILGVCLGHQCIGDNLGMRVERHTTIMHGKTSPVFHDNTGVYEGLPNPFTATRYHSLIVRAEDLPEGWAVNAWCEDLLDGEPTRVVMGLSRRWEKAAMEGVQFHPESYLTDAGPLLLANFLGLPRPAMTAATP